MTAPKSAAKAPEKAPPKVDVKVPAKKTVSVPTPAAAMDAKAAAEQVTDVKPAAETPKTVKVVFSAQPVKVDGRNQRNDNDALEGGFANVVDGKYKGKFGMFLYPTEYGSDGYPTKVWFRTRDAQAQEFVVDYADIRPSKRNGGR